MHLRDESQEEEGLKAIVEAAEKRQESRVLSDCTREGKGTSRMPKQVCLGHFLTCQSTGQSTGSKESSGNRLP